VATIRDASGVDLAHPAPYLGRLGNLPTRRNLWARPRA